MTIANDDLINAAREARRSAYNRYSNFAVGAALIDDRGHLHVGCNVENAAYPLGSCAEAGAIAAMVLQGVHGPTSPIPPITAIFAILLPPCNTIAAIAPASAQLPSG